MLRMGDLRAPKINGCFVQKISLQQDVASSASDQNPINLDIRQHKKIISQQTHHTSLNSCRWPAIASYENRPSRNSTQSGRRYAQLPTELMLPKTFFFQISKNKVTHFVCRSSLSQHQPHVSHVFVSNKN